jgi:hypothetical protein
MRSRGTFYTALLIAGFFVLPHIAQASIPFFGPIVPDEINRCAAGWGAVIMIINRTIEFLITLIIVFIAPVMIAYAGFLFVVNPVNASGKEQAKKVLWNTVVGLVIALAGWLIVDAVMAVLYKPPSGSTWGAWSSLVTSGGEAYCLIQEASLQNLNQGQISGASETGVISVVPPTTEPASEGLIRQQFASAGVQINHPTACNPYNTNGVTNGCTNVGNMLPATVSQVIALKNACGGGCVVMITGGSEAGHASGIYSHGAGYKVDLAVTSSALNNFLQRLPLSGQRGGDSGGPIRKDTCGNQYVQESNHWDITVLRTCSL